MQRLSSLLRSAALAAVLSVAAFGAASAILFYSTAYASGPGSDDDTPDFDDLEIDEPDDDNSGPGGGDDWDQDWDDSPDIDDAEYDNSGHAGDDVGDADDDNSGQGNSRNDHDVDRDTAESNVDEIMYSVEYDNHGDEYTPGEIVFIGQRRDLTIATDLGLRRLRLQTLNSGGVMARLALPPGINMDQALAMVAQAAPNALVTPNNIYRSAQSVGPAPAATPNRHSPRLRGAMGVIDTGVDPASLPVRGALLSQRAFAGARAIPREHGSMVASIAVARGVRVHVADVFGQSADGALAASAERIVAALDWMIAHRIAVVNISVEGPNNAILNEMIQRASQRGHIIVAAAGNGGPAARPTFPAAFDSVQAVTAIDETGRPYVRANRGDYIDFAARGVDVNVGVGDSVARVSGTSFAAPVIAAEAALHLHSPSPDEAERVLAGMRNRAVDLGEPGHDIIFGWGALRD